MSLAGNSGRLTWIRHNSPQEQRCTYSCQCGQYFPTSKQWYGCQCLGFLTCEKMLVRAIVHEGCTDAVRVCTGSRIQARLNPKTLLNQNRPGRWGWGVVGSFAANPMPHAGPLYTGCRPSSTWLDPTHRLALTLFRVRGQESRRF